MGNRLGAQEVPYNEVSGINSIPKECSPSTETDGTGGGKYSSSPPEADKQDATPIGANVFTDRMKSFGPEYHERQG